MTKKLHLALLFLLVGLTPLATSAQYWWSNEEGGTYNIPSEEYNPVNHAFGSSDNEIYNKIGFDPSANNPKTMRIKDVSGSYIDMYDFMGNIMPDRARDNRAIGWDWENDDRNGGIIAASIAQIRVGNTNHTMVYAWSVLTDGRRRSGWIKLSDLEDGNGIKNMLEDNKDGRMAILKTGGIDEAIYDEYRVIEARLPAYAEEYYIRGGRDETKSQGKAKYYYTRDGYISGIKNIMENSKQRYGVAHNNIPLGAKFYKDRNFKQVDVEIYAGVEDEDDYADNHVFTPISERLQIVWGYTVTGAGEKIYSFINNRTLVATGNNDVTNNEPAPTPTPTPSGDEFIPNPNKLYYIDNPTWNKRLASNGASEEAYLTSTSTTNADTQWKFVAKGNGYWHIQRAAGGAKPRLRTDNTAFADMQETSSSLTYTYFHFPEGKSAGTYHVRLPEGPTNFKKLQIGSNGDIKFVSDAGIGNWESFKITEAPNTQNPIPITGNIAPDGTVSQSSTANGGSASRAIDRNTSGVYTQNSVTHTNIESRPHWQVEWNDVYEINEIKIYNRTDCCKDRLSDFRVFVIDDNTGDINFRQDYTGISGSSLTINTGGVKGTRVKIRLNGTNYLSLAEVEVKGTRLNNLISSSNLVQNSLAASTFQIATVDKVTLFPNPASDHVNVYTAENVDVKELHIYDSLGRGIESHEINYKFVQNNTFSIRTNHLETGLYTVQLELTDGTTEALRLLVKHD